MTRLDIFFDPVCPWCLIGKANLDRALEARRKELNSLVAQYARVTGVPHSHVHAELRRQCGGPPLARATTEQVEQRIALIRTWRR